MTWNGKSLSAKAASLVLLASALTTSGAQSQPAKIAGPIPATDMPGAPGHDYPFFASNRQLALYGYVEEEFFISGSARAASTPYAAGTFAQGTLMGAPRPYQTRLLVRRPLNKAQFNGVVIVEWSNVSNRFEADNVWLLMQDHLVRAGYAWVGVSAQGFGGVESLRVWSPRRYGELEIPNGGRMAAEPLALDIFKQAAQAVRTDAGGRLFGGFSPKIIIGAGQSQAALWLTSYLNGGWAGDGVLDGLLLLSATGAQFRPDSSLPILRIVPEGDVRGEDAKHQTPDTAHFRQWEIAGASHVDRTLRSAREPLQLRDLGSSIQADLAAQCGHPGIGTETRADLVLAAGLNALAGWSTGGAPPPHAPRLQRRSDGAGQVELARDVDGIALGGIRLPDVAAPVGLNSGMNEGSAAACQVQGYYQPYDIETLRRRYGSPLQYVEAVEKAVGENVEQGFILRPDAEQIVEAARQASW